MTEIVTAVAMMTRDEAQRTHDAITQTASDLARLLIDMRDREGWRALGFTSWTHYLHEGGHGFTRATLYRRLAAYEVSQHETRDKPRPQAHYLTVGEYPEQYHETILAAAESVERSGEKVTAGVLRSIGDNITQAAMTGFVDDADGNPLSIAIKASVDELRQRQQQHIDASRDLTYAGRFEATVHTNDKGYLVLRLADGSAAPVMVGQHVQMTIKVKDAA